MKPEKIKRVTQIYSAILVIVVLTLLSRETIEILESSSFSFDALIDALFFTSVIAFFPTVLFLILTFRWNKKNYFLWLVILLNLPFAITYSPDLYQNISLSAVDSTTPSEFIYVNNVDRNTYKNDIRHIEQKIDSLIRIGVVTRPTHYGERYFEGVIYKDSLERRRGFPATPHRVPIELSVDTLFYSPDSNNYIAGTLIRTYPVDQTEYSNDDTVRFLGNAFVFNPNDEGFHFITLRTSISEYHSEKRCAESLLRVYLKERGLKDGYYNLNDTRFWTNSDWEKRFKPY